MQNTQSKAKDAKKDFFFHFVLQQLWLINAGTKGELFVWNAANKRDDKILIF